MQHEASTSYLNPTQQQVHRTPSNGSSNSAQTFNSTYSSEGQQTRGDSRSPAPPTGPPQQQVRATGLPPRGDSRSGAMRSQTLPPGSADTDYYQYRPQHNSSGAPQPQWGAPPPGGGYGASLLPSFQPRSLRSACGSRLWPGRLYWRDSPQPRCRRDSFPPPSGWGRAIPVRRARARGLTH